MPLRGMKRKASLGPLDENDAVLGGLIDVWTTINKCQGTKPQAP